MRGHSNREEITAVILERAYWCGFVSRKQIEADCGIGHTLASEILGQLTGQGFLRAQGKRHVLAHGAAQRLESQGLVRSERAFDGLISCGAIRADAGVTAWQMDELQAPIDAVVLRELISATAASRAVVIQFVPMDEAVEPMRLTVEPVEFFRDGGVWHVFAFSHLDRRCRSFALTQILSCEAPGAPRWRSPSRDRELQTIEQARFAAHPDLNAMQEKVVRHRFGMVEECLAVAWPRARLMQFRERHVSPHAILVPGRFLVELAPDGASD